jgi:hypothetical protein
MGTISYCPRWVIGGHVHCKNRCPLWAICGQTRVTRAGRSVCGACRDQKARYRRKMPAAAIAAPARRGTSRPVGMIFSNRTKIVRPAIQSRFMTPPTNRSAISTQQQPTHSEPCSAPSRSEPHGLALKPPRLIRNPSGDWQWVRQASFSGDH